ncbi:MAG TPA: 3-phosphoglycerate dehydrogenase [Firmicutes bacterium]|nr:3-phosphoglycerate dehydrogenase [Bacillota bacterium]
MKEVLRLNPISPLIDTVFGDKYKLVAESEAPVGILVRSFKMHDYEPAKSVLCVGRAGAGVNNIPCDKYGQEGIVVFNAPGANANAVKELVILSLLLCGRKIIPGIAWTQSLKGKGDEVGPAVEKGKKDFVGGEIFGKRIGIYGLGAIGKLVANACAALGMEVVAYNRTVREELKKELDPRIKLAGSFEEMLEGCDYVSLHVALKDNTRECINASTIAKLNDGASIVNAARGELVNVADVKAALASGKLNRYVVDFPSDDVLGVDGIIPIPHLGASTPEAEDNCAVMAGKELVDFVENGNIVNSVNYPDVSMEKSGAQRVVVLMNVAEPPCDAVKAAIAKAGVNVVNSVCKNGKATSAALLDIDKKADESLVSALEAIDGVARARLI